ncbi:MAG: hypothetical protein V4481_02730 [Patescibacteria group bacterium]
MDQPQEYKLDALELYQATCLTLSNKPSIKTDAVFFHARGVGDDDGLFEVVAQLYKNGLAEKIVITNFDGISTTEPGKRIASGKEYYLEQLSSLVPKEAIVCADSAENTLTENRAFLDLAQKSGWKSGVIVAQPHQLLRAMLGAVKGVQKRHMDFRLYSACPQTTNWKKDTFVNQGVPSTRFDNISAELERIPRYIAKGDIATLQELISYICSSI